MLIIRIPLLSTTHRDIQRWHRRAVSGFSLFEHDRRLEGEWQWPHRENCLVGRRELFDTAWLGIFEVLVESLRPLSGAPYMKCNGIWTYIGITFTHRGRSWDLKIRSSWDCVRQHNIWHHHLKKNSHFPNWSLEAPEKMYVFKDKRSLTCSLSIDCLSGRTPKHWSRFLGHSEGRKCGTCFIFLFFYQR